LGPDSRKKISIAMGKITIQGAKFLRERAEIDFTEERGGKLKPYKANEEYTDTPHPDLIAAFKRLKVHAAIIGEFAEPQEVGDITKPVHPVLSDIFVLGFSISGKDRDQVSFSVQKRLRTGKMMGLNLPLQKIGGDTTGAYQYSRELQEVLDTCVDEVTEYLNGKVGDPEQGELQFPEPKTNKIKVLPEERPVLKIVEGPKQGDLRVSAPEAGNGTQEEPIAKTRRKRAPQTPENPSGLN